MPPGYAFNTQDLSAVRDMFFNLYFYTYLLKKGSINIDFQL